MAKHMISFSHFKDNVLVEPKDRLPIKLKDNRETKYDLVKDRFIYTTP